MFCIFSEFWMGEFRTLDKTVEAVSTKLHFLYPEKNFGWFCLPKNLFFRIQSVYERKKKFVLRGKKFSSLLKSALCVFWSLFSNFHPVFCGLWIYQNLSEVFLVWLAIASFYRSTFLLEDKSFFWKSNFLCLFCALREKHFHTRNLDVSPVSSNLHFTCPEERSGRKLSGKKTSQIFVLTLSRMLPDFKHFLFDMHFTKFTFYCRPYVGVKNSMKKTNLTFFSKLWAEDFLTSEKLLRQSSQNCILRTQSKSLEEFFFKKNLNSYFYSAFERKQFVLWVNTFTSLLKIASYVNRKLLRVLYWFLLGFWKYQTLSETFLVFLAKAPFCQSGFLLDGKTFPRKKFFCRCLVHFRQKIFTHRTENFRQSSGIWVVRVQKKIFEEKIPGKILLSTLILSISGKFSDFQQIFFRHALHKLPLSFSKQYVGGKKCLRIKSVLYFFRILNGRISHFGQNSWGSINKTAFFVPREKLWMILFAKKSIFSNSICLWAEEEVRTSREKI